MKTVGEVAKKQPKLVRKILSKFTKIPNFAEFIKIWNFGEFT